MWPWPDIMADGLSWEDPRLSECVLNSKCHHGQSRIVNDTVSSYDNTGKYRTFRGKTGLPSCNMPTTVLLCIGL